MDIQKTEQSTTYTIDDLEVEVEEIYHPTSWSKIWVYKNGTAEAAFDTWKEAIDIFPQLLHIKAIHNDNKTND